jgi:3-isopropylmalate/(R)-2-methylmalate dehydratase small subunit
MEKFTAVCGVAAPLPQANIDTDVIMPKQFLKGITRDDLARGLFYDLRFDAQGVERDEFVLNRPEYRQSRFLVVGPNFGCGSSREHAVWGLVQWGIRAIIGSSFASIFHDNCFRNGVLPIALPPQQAAALQSVCTDPSRSILRVDLNEQSIELHDGSLLRFAIDPMRRDDLLNGRDAVASTLRFADDIEAFERGHWTRWPWLRPQAAGR